MLNSAISAKMAAPLVAAASRGLSAVADASGPDVKDGISSKRLSGRGGVS
jgi:hypothetical protein